MKHGLWTCCLVTALIASPMFLVCLGDSAFAQDAQAQNENNEASAPADDSAQNVENAENAAPAKSIYDEENLKPRDIYNRALNQLNSQKYETAIEGFLRARDTAETIDHELRYAASYNLAYTYAGKAAAAGDINTLEAEQLQGVIDDLTNSVAWFRDAVRQRPSLQESAGNLEITLKRLLAARDVMAQKYNTLEKQLEDVLATERQIRENSRVLSERIFEANAERDPIAFLDEFNALASIQREALTQTNLVAENLDNELAAIENKAEDQRSQEESFRGFQLKSASPLLETARQAMASARRQMREAALSDALRLTNKAFNYVKQAREQLENPLAILGHITEDENGFLRFATAKYMFSDPQMLEQYKAAMNRDDLAEPSWLNNDLLTDNQIDTLIRTNRVVEFLKTVTEAAKQQPQDAQQNPEQAEAAKQQMEQIEDALPFIQNAASFMQTVTQKLEVSDYKGSVEEASKAVEQLAMAMERFADLKHLIEIAYSAQLATEPVVRGEVGGENAQLLSREQQRNLLIPALNVNRERLERLATLLAKEASKATQMQGQNGQQPSQEQIQQMQQVFETAENLRQNAADAISRMIQTASIPAEEGVDEAIVPTDISDAVWTDLAGDEEIAKKSLEQLRMIFFTIIEHIQELLKQQVATMDQTTDAASGKPEEIEMTLPPILDRQHQHELISNQLAEELVKQAEQLQNQAGQQQQGGPDPAEMAQRYREAASELQAASTVMRQIQTDLSSTEHLFTEAIEEQKTAAEHIQKALEILQPPQQQQQQQQQQQEQQQQDQQQQQQQQQQKMSKEQAEKKIQEIRSRDKERRKNKDEKNAAGMPVVEKDW